MDMLGKLGGMLRAEEAHKRIAAAVVLGELRIKDPQIVKALCDLAQDPFDAYAHAALRALGEIGSLKAIPALLAALGRGGETRKVAAVALAALGPEALPEIKERLSDAAPEIRAAVSQALPAIGGGRESFQLALDGLHGQPWEAVNRVALSVRQEVRSASPADLKARRAQLEKFVALKKTQQDEPALRGALKILGYLELPETAEVLLGYAAPKNTTMVRLEAITALRFALSRSATLKALRKLGEWLDEKDPLIRRAARDTLMTLKIGKELSTELATLAAHTDMEVAAWAIALLGTMGGEVAEKALLPIAYGKHRTRAQAAARAVAALEGAERLLALGLIRAQEEVGAHVLSEALMPLVRKLSRKDLAKLREAGEDALSESVALATRKLEPVRQLDPEGWAQTLRDKAASFLKKDPARASALYQLLCRSPLATQADRYTFAKMELSRSTMDPHPSARARDGALLELERLNEDGFPLAATLAKDKAIDDGALFYLGFHFIESTAPEHRGVGEELLEALGARSARTKLGKAAKNKLKLTTREG